MLYRFLDTVEEQSQLVIILPCRYPVPVRLDDHHNKDDASRCGQDDGHGQPAPADLDEDLLHERIAHDSGIAWGRADCLGHARGDGLHGDAQVVRPGQRLAHWRRIWNVRETNAQAGG